MTKPSYSTTGLHGEGRMFPERQSITAFLRWLRDGHSGFETSDQQYMAAHDLIRAILESDEDKISPVTAWSTLLAPVLCSSETQQSEFYEIFERWFLDRETMVSPLIEESGNTQRRLNLDVWLYGLAALTLAVVLGWFIYRHWSVPRASSHAVLSGPPRPVKPALPATKLAVLIEYANSPIAGADVSYAGKVAVSTEDGYVELPRSAPATYLQVTAKGFKPTVIPFPKSDAVVGLTRPVPVRLEEIDSRWHSSYGARIRRGLMVLPALLLLGWLVQRWRRALELHRWASVVEPRMRRLSSSWRAQPLFPSSDIRKLATTLRRRRSEESPELDVSQTVEMTCREYGWFTPVYAKRTSEPEYLFVGERKNLRDQQARLQDELLGCLRNHDVFVQRYYFQSDPTICSDLKGDVYSLNELAVLHPHHELWLGLESDACLDPVTGELRPWLVPLEQWRDRALLSFHAPRVPLGMPVAAPTRRGLEVLAGYTLQLKAEKPYPPLLRSNLERWVQRIEPPEANTPMLELQLQRYLGEGGYLLLQACAVYPALAWNITLALAAELLSLEQREDLLWKLSALPWFRHGTMPNWFRVRLLSRLGSKETQVRVALRKYLDQTAVRADEKQEALDIVPGKPKLSTARLALQDHVFLSFASGRRLDQLSVEAPPKWRRFLRESAVLRIGLALLSLALIWLMLGKLLKEVDQRIKLRPGQAVAVGTPKDKFTAELFTVAQALDPAPASKFPSQSGVPDLLLYSNVASDILNVVNPFPDEDRLLQSAKQVASGLATPGEAVDVGGHLQMVEAVASGKVWLFQSTSWKSQSELSSVYDLHYATLLSAEYDPQRDLAKSAVSVAPTSGGPSSNTALPGVNSASGEIAPGAIAGGVTAEGGQATPIKVLVDSAGLYQSAAKKLSAGAGELRFGMPWTQVNEKLSVPFGPSDYEALPVAGEFAPADVRYIWVRLSAIVDRKGFGEYLSLLQPFEACMQNGSQSYIVFDFADNKLIRISSRFFDDCTGREAFLQKFVSSLGLGLPGLPPQSQSLNLTIGSTNVSWYLGSNPSPDALDIWKQGSPAPTTDIFNPPVVTIKPVNAPAQLANRSVNQSQPQRQKTTPESKVRPQATSNLQKAESTPPAPNSAGGGSSCTGSNSAAPVVTAVTPNTGPAQGGFSVVVEGRGFCGATSVTAGGWKAETFSVISDTEVRAELAGLPATAPIAQSGYEVDVAVCNGFGCSPQYIPGNFKYLPR